MHVRRMRRIRECTLVTRGGRFTAHARRETARGMLGSTTGRSMLMLALMQVVVQCIIEYEYGTGTVQFVTVFLGICVATAPLYILESSLAPDLLFDIGFFA